MDKCLWCDGFLNSDLKLHFIFSFQPFVPQYLCDKCKALFKIDNETPQCCDCGRFQATTDRCDDCEKWLQQGRQLVNRALFPYHGIIQEYLQRYKFKGDFRLRLFFQQALAQKIKQDEVVVPIPITAKTMAKRHFNQVTGMLEMLDYIDCLTAREKEQNQVEKGRSARINVAQPFEFKAEFKSQIKGRRIVIVDDVYTTGTTLHHAANLLSKNGAKTVRSLTLAR